jgi:hypothetical protein
VGDELIPAGRRGVPAIVHLYRFFTGHHLDGKRRQHRQSGKVMPQYRDYYWNRYSRGRRALVRNVVFWFAAISGWLVWANERLAAFLGCAILPFVCFKLCQKLWKVWFVQTTVTDSHGVRETYWHLRPKYYRRVAKWRNRRIKLSPPASDALPAEYERPTLAAIAEDGGDPVTSLRVAASVDEMIESEAKPSRTRGRTYRGSVRRRTG